MSKSFFTFSEVSQHSSPGDCWLVLHNKVYNVTKFLDQHPGGDEVILTATGKDATTDFEDVGHSKLAREMLKDYYIGEIDVSTIPNTTKSCAVVASSKQLAHDPDKSFQFFLKTLQWSKYNPKYVLVISIVFLPVLTTILLWLYVVFEDMLDH